MANEKKTVLVPIATGSEEIETTCIVDTLRRAGAEVTLASVEKDLKVLLSPISPLVLIYILIIESQVVCSRQMKIEADCLIGECVNKDYDLVALPGGMPVRTNI